jgi:hypothetical protein
LPEGSKRAYKKKPTQVTTADLLVVGGQSIQTALHQIRFMSYSGGEVDRGRVASFMEETFEYRRAWMNEQNPSNYPKFELVPSLVIFILCEF